MPNLGDELHLGRLERVAGGDVDVDHKSPPFERRALPSHDRRHEIKGKDPCYTTAIWNTALHPRSPVSTTVGGPSFDLLIFSFKHKGKWKMGAVGDDRNPPLPSPLKRRAPSMAIDTETRMNKQPVCTTQTGCYCLLLPTAERFSY